MRSPLARYWATRILNRVGHLEAYRLLPSDWSKREGFQSQWKELAEFSCVALRNEALVGVL